MIINIVQNGIKKKHETISTIYRNKQGLAYHVGAYEAICEDFTLRWTFSLPQTQTLYRLARKREIEFSLDRLIYETMYRVNKRYQV